MFRRNDFSVEPQPRALPVKEPRAQAARAKPTVSRDVAEIASHLAANPVFVDLMAGLRREATDRLTNSSLGQAGAEERETARYELEALRIIENRLMGIGAELVLHAPPNDTATD
jgi:hypothetical protein